MSRIPSSVAVSAWAVLLVGIACSGARDEHEEIPVPAPEVATEPSESQPPAPRPALVGITREADARLLPGPPGNLEVRRSRAGATIRWQGTRLDILESYLLYRRCRAGDWERLAIVPVEPPNDGWYEFADREGQGCDYAISSFDHYGNEGPKSEVAGEPKAEASDLN